MSKERLVELIEKAKVLRSLDILSGDPDVIVDMPTEDEYIANYLLANGIIVPPCKVGIRFIRQMVCGYTKVQYTKYRLLQIHLHRFFIQEILHLMNRQSENPSSSQEKKQKRS